MTFFFVHTKLRKIKLIFNRSLAYIELLFCNSVLGKYLVRKL